MVGLLEKDFGIRITGVGLDLVEAVGGDKSGNVFLSATSDDEDVSSKSLS